MTRSIRITVLVLLVLLPAALCSTAAASEGKTYGEPLGGSDTIPISVLLADPDQHVGEIVRVEGLVTAVCEKRGCWMTLASDEEFQDLRLKVQDGVIVFPLSAKGKRAIAEGKLAKIEMTLEETIRYREHQAQEHGLTFDPASVTEPLAFYQIDVTGAVIR